jgi:hypothetical protein
MPVPTVTTIQQAGCCSSAARCSSSQAGSSTLALPGPDKVPAAPTVAPTAAAPTKAAVIGHAQACSKQHLGGLSDRCIQRGYVGAICQQHLEALAAAGASGSIGSGSSTWKHWQRQQHLLHQVCTAGLFENRRIQQLALAGKQDLNSIVKRACVRACVCVCVCFVAIE